MRAAVLTLLALGCAPARDVSIGTEDAGPPVAFILTFAPDAPVATGDEGVHCLDIPGPAEDTWVSGWRVRKQGAHHVNVWRRKPGGATTPWTTVSPCAGGWGRGTFILDSSKPDLIETLPEGTAMLIPGGSSLIFDVHYVNTTEAPLDERITVDFFDGTDHDTEASGLLWFGGAGAVGPLDLGPGQEKTVTFSPTLPLHADNEILTLMGHEHAHGISETVMVDGAEVYRSDNWAEPPVLSTSVHVGTESKVSWSCTFRNDGTGVVQWGSRVADTEMCQVFGLATGPHWESQAKIGAFQ